MKKTVIALLSLTGVAMGAGGTATLGDGITGTWTEYNKQDYITTSSNSISFGGEDWGGATAWITLADTVTLGKDQVLTFSYTLGKNCSNGIYSISFLGAGGQSAFFIGNTDYGKDNVAAASVTLATTGFYQNCAQAIRFNAGHSGDRIQAVSADGVDAIDTPTPGEVTATIKYDTSASDYILTLSAGEFEKDYNLGDSVSFSKIVFTSDVNANGQALSGISMSIKSVPEPATATLSLLALCGLAARRRRK